MSKLKCTNVENLAFNDHKVTFKNEHHTVIVHHHHQGDVDFVKDEEYSVDEILGEAKPKKKEKVK